MIYSNNIANDILNSIDMYNHYCKLPDFKDRCVTDGVHKHSFYKNKFYTVKSYFINSIMLDRPELVSEWHIEYRGHETFYIIAFTVNGHEYRFHQKRDDINWMFLIANCADAHSKDGKYYHDEYPDTRTYEFDDNAMSAMLCRLLIKLYSKTN